MATGGALEFEITEASALTKLRRLADEGVFDAQKSRFWFDYCLQSAVCRLRRAHWSMLLTKGSGFSPMRNGKSVPPTLISFR